MIGSEYDVGGKGQVKKFEVIVGRHASSFGGAVMIPDRYPHLLQRNLALQISLAQLVCFLTCEIKEISQLTDALTEKF
jgi:hypothetical protein